MLKRNSALLFSTHSHCTVVAVSVKTQMVDSLHHVTTSLCQVNAEFRCHATFTQERMHCATQCKLCSNGNSLYSCACRVVPQWKSKQRIKERSCVCKQNQLKKNHIHFTHRSYRDEHNKSTLRKKKMVRPTLNVVKKFCIQAQNLPVIFRQT